MRWDAPIFDLAGVLQFYDEEINGSRDVFLKEYIKESKQLNHPNIDSIIESIEYIEDATFIANGLELNLMIKGGILESEYIEYLCGKLA